MPECLQMYVSRHSETDGQDMLGHASPATTRIYAQVSTKRMRAAHQQAFPK